MEIKTQADKKIRFWMDDSTLVPREGRNGSRTWPKISIVTPSLNQGRFLEDTIRSVILQGYPNLEYIIIDGGSTDDSVDIIRRYERWISYWISEPDNGQAEAINKGFRRATGEIFAWLNSDDVYAEGALKKIGTFFSNHPDVDLTYGGCVYISENNLIIKKPKIVPYNRDELFIRNIIAQPSTFFHKRLFEKAGPLDEKLHLCFDAALWRNASLKHRIRNNSYYLSYFRFHSDSKSVFHSLKMKKESAEVAVNILQHANSVDANLRQILRFRYLQLGILCWKMEPRNESRIAHYLEEAFIDDDLFTNQYIQRLFFTFVDLTYLDFNTLDREAMKAITLDVKKFAFRYLAPLNLPKHEKHVSAIISHCYLMFSVKKRDIPMLLKGIMLCPMYLGQFARQIFFEMKELYFAQWLHDRKLTCNDA